MPYSLELPDATADRYRTVLDVIDATHRLIAAHSAAFPADAAALAGFRYPDEFRTEVAGLAAAVVPLPVGAPPPVVPATVGPPPPSATVGFARVKQILDGSVAGWAAANGGAAPKLTQRHQSPAFGWATKPQLLAATALDFRLIEPGVAGKDTNLVKALRDDDGVDGNGRMPAGGPFLPPDQIGEIVAWIDAGTPD